jgi:hypothetical protein
MPIPSRFYLFWGKGTSFPYVRYLTFATCRIQHPEADINLYLCRCNDEDKWGQGAFCDFQYNGHDLLKLYAVLQKDNIQVDEQTRKFIFDTLLDGKEPAPWDRIKYDRDAIEKAIRTSKTREELAVALDAVIAKRKEREAKKPKKHDYIQDAVERLGVKICEYTPADNRVYTMPPPNVSDIFSVEILMTDGGVYLDCDQVVLKPLRAFTANYDFFMGGQHCPYVGIFGSKARGLIVTDFYSNMLKSFDEKYYNSTGVQAIFKNCIQSNDWLKWFKTCGEKNHIVAQEHFYPLYAHDGAQRFWKGDFDINKCNSSCVHFYGNNPISNQMCRDLGPENILEGNHCYAQYLRKLTNNGKGFKQQFCWG